MMTVSLKGFLTFLRSNYLRENISKGTPLNIVCGNQSADMDSVLSSLTYAYYSYIKHPESPIVPVINIPKEDLKLRKDIVYVLQEKAGIKENDDLLFFIKDIKDYKEHYDCKVHSVLVDHNALDGAAATVIDEVVGIIDHHEDMGTSRDSIKKYHGPDIVQVTGSCSSLVTNYWFEKLSQDSYAMRNVCQLGLAALLIDTSNLKSKVENPDLRALDVYKSQLPKGFSLDEYFNTIRKEKDNLEGLSVYDLLRKDYKQFVYGGFKIGMSSLVKSTEWLYEQYGDKEIVSSCEDYSKSIDALMLLSSYVTSGNFKRELVLVTKNQKLKSKIFSGITEVLELELLKDGKLSYDTYNQKNISASRKQIAPAVKDAIEKN